MKFLGAKVKVREAFEHKICKKMRFLTSDFSPSGSKKSLPSRHTDFILSIDLSLVMMHETLFDYLRVKVINHSFFEVCIRKRKSHNSALAESICTKLAG